MTRSTGRDSALRCPRTPQRGVPTAAKKLRVRRQLPHEFPLWVDPNKATYFMTICCRRRGANQLTYPKIAEEIFETIEHRNAHELWYVHLALLMPDHVHLLISFPESSKSIQAIMSKWKEWTAKTVKVKWQRDFFEHRLRTTESFDDKADYILLNPVRAGLVERVEDWPYVFIAEQ